MPPCTTRWPGRGPHDGPAVERHRPAERAPAPCASRAACTWPTSATSAASRRWSSLVAHDDGRNPQDLRERRHRASGRFALVEDARFPSTWPMQGYKVANVPLALGTEPPRQMLRRATRTRLFGLMTIARRARGHPPAAAGRLGRAGVAVASSYARPGVRCTATSRRRALSCANSGCIVIHTEQIKRRGGRPLRRFCAYYERAHPAHESRQIDGMNVPLA